MSVSKGEDNGSFGAQNSSVSGGWGRRATGNKITDIVYWTVKSVTERKRGGWVGSSKSMHACCR